MSDEDRPLCCQINDALCEIGSERVKEIVEAMISGGMDRDEINTLLATEIVPQFEAWRAAKLDKLMRILTDDAHPTIN
jgi:hypothetical protein